MGKLYSDSLQDPPWCGEIVFFHDNSNSGLVEKVLNRGEETGFVTEWRTREWLGTHVTAVRFNPQYGTDVDAAALIYCELGGVMDFERGGFGSMYGRKGDLGPRS